MLAWRILTLQGVNLGQSVNWRCSRLGGGKGIESVECYKIQPWCSKRFNSMNLWNTVLTAGDLWQLSTANDPQMTLNTKRSKVPHIHACNNYPQVPNFTPFHSTVRRFELQAILRQVHWMTPKWPWRLIGQRYPIHVLYISLSPKLHSVLLYDYPFPKNWQFFTFPLATMINFNLFWKFLWLT